MAIVVDASIAVAWAFDDERPSAVHALSHVQADGGIAPGLWWYEIRNSLLMNERRGRITEAVTAAFLHFLSRLPITIDHVPDESSILAIARTYRLTVYDAAYLELAQRESASVATLDSAMARVARALKIPLI
jgi:predicted nucleic acid-binding protein